MKLQFICIKTELVDLADEERRHLMKAIRESTKTANIMHLTTEETQIPKGCHFFAHHVYVCIYLLPFSFCFSLLLLFLYF